MLLAGKNILGIRLKVRNMDNKGIASTINLKAQKPRKLWHSASKQVSSETI